MTNIPVADPTRFPNGLATDDSERFGGKIRIIDPSQTITYFEDFMGLDAAANLMTYQSGAGGTFSSANEGEGGFGVSLTAGVSGASVGIRLDNGFFQSSNNGKRLFFKIRFKIDSFFKSTFAAGFTEAAAVNPELASDKLIFIKSNEDSILRIEVKNSSIGLTDSTNLFDISDDTFVSVSLIYDGNNIRVFQNDDLISIVSSVNVPTALILPNIFIRTTEGAARTLTTDYFLAGKDR